jgi:hypothetical protein
MELDWAHCALWLGTLCPMNQCGSKESNHDWFLRVRSKCPGEASLSGSAAVSGLEPKAVGIQMRQFTVFPTRLVLRMLTAPLSCARILKVSCVTLLLQTFPDWHIFWILHILCFWLMKTFQKLVLFPSSCRVIFIFFIKMYRRKLRPLTSFFFSLYSAFISEFHRQYYLINSSSNHQPDLPVLKYLPQFSKFMYIRYDISNIFIASLLTRNCGIYC